MKYLKVLFIVIAIAITVSCATKIVVDGIGIEIAKSE